MKHIEILVEDSSGKKIIEILLNRIAGLPGEKCTYRIHPYKGIGRIPKDLKGKSDPQKRILLDRLHNLLQGYGKSFLNEEYSVLVVVDCDTRNCIDFKNEMLAVLNKCNPKPVTMFRIAIEEMEAWLLGDLEAVNKAYPKARNDILISYRNDSICGTWELLADAVYSGGKAVLSKKSYFEIGTVKHEWAEKITPLVRIEENLSPSFHCFVDAIYKLSGVDKV
jgi:hypothetical protein